MTGVGRMPGTLMLSLQGAALYDRSYGLLAIVSRCLPGIGLAGVSLPGSALPVGGEEAIDRYLSGIPQPKMPPVPVRRARVKWMEVPAITKMTIRRPEMPLLNIEGLHLGSLGPTGF
jgi:hypothetical protein